MESRELLIYLAVLFKGNWDKIYEALQVREEYETQEQQAKKCIANLKSKAITFLDDEYPESLKRVTKPPFALFYHGDISLLKSENILAVVGTRHPSEYGTKYTTSFVKQLCKDFVIVSGCALGIDATAHRACIKNQGKTIAVLGCGINVCYLKSNLDIYEECKKNHLVISEYPDSTIPEPTNFPIRNRIIVALADVLFVPEGKNNSGTQISTWLMAQKNGNVCALPERIDVDSVCNSLIAEGAYLVQSPRDIYEVAGVTPKRPIFEK